MSDVACKPTIAAGCRLPLRSVEPIMLQKLRDIWRRWRERGRQDDVDRVTYRGAADEAVIHRDSQMP